MRNLLLTTLAVSVFTGPARAVDDYDTCIAMIASDPGRAEREAGDWARYGGGGPAARHCYALALIEVGASLLAFEAEATIVLDRSRLIQRADAQGVTLLAIGADCRTKLRLEEGT